MSGGIMKAEDIIFANELNLSTSGLWREISLRHRIYFDHNGVAHVFAQGFQQWVFPKGSFSV